jgi:hypothetical protein
MTALARRKKKERVMHIPARRMSAGWFVAPAIAGLAVLFLSGHRDHALDYLPFLLLLACPLMHLFMHGGHHHEEPGTRGGGQMRGPGA